MLIEPLYGEEGGHPRCPIYVLVVGVGVARKEVPKELIVERPDFSWVESSLYRQLFMTLCLAAGLTSSVPLYRSEQFGKFRLFFCGQSCGDGVDALVLGRGSVRDIVG